MQRVTESTPFSVGSRGLNKLLELRAAPPYLRIKDQQVSFSHVVIIISTYSTSMCSVGDINVRNEI